MTRGASTLAWSLAALAAVLFAGDIVLWAAYGAFGELGPLPVLKVLAGAVGALGPPLVGAFLAARLPRNPVGWLVLAFSLVFGITQFSYLYSLYPTGAEFGDVLPLQHPVGHLALALEAAPGLFIPFVILLFPDGRLPSRRWRPLAWLTGLAVLFPVVVTAATPNASYGPDESTVLSAAKYHGYGDGEWLGTLVYGSWELAKVLLIVAALSLLVRMRRAQGDERQQLKWAAFGSVLFALYTYLVPLLVPELVGQPALHRLLVDVVYPFVIPVATALVPACFAVGILKYRLYDIDVVISKTVVYGSLAALVTAVYVGVVVGLGHALGSAARPSIGLWILATTLVALGFHPARERLQHLANRLVYGRRAEPYDVLAEFARSMSDALSVEEVLPRMAEAVAQGIRAERSLVRVFLPRGRERAVVWPGGSGPLNFDRTIAVAHRGEAVGEISVAKPPGDKLSAAEQKLLEDLGSQAGTALRNVGLLVELERRLEEISDQAEELRASRGRIVSAQDAERRRLERNLHDGAQQQLVSLSGKLRLLRRLLAANGAQAWPLAEELVTEADEALDSVRDLARGIFPQLLAEGGLAVALAAQVAKQAPGAARLECEPSAAAARFDPRVEAAVYFCCLEALQNAGKHAAGASVVVSLSYEGDFLEFSVSDRGPGLDPSAVSGGSGLQNMRDRIAAVGGRLEVRSEVGRGTTVFGLVPAFDGAGRTVAESAAIPSGLTA